MPETGRQSAARRGELVDVCPGHIAEEADYQVMLDAVGYHLTPVLPTLRR